MICLGIESTAHTFGAGIVDSKGNVLSNARDTFLAKPGKGIVPREAANHHADVCAAVIKKALEEAKLKLSDIDLIAFAQGPGLPPCLRVGAVAARTLSLKLNKPLIGVNHAVAHIEIGKLTTGAKDPVILYVSGGNTQVLAFAGGRYRVFGETLDIPIGNALDQFAREAGLGNPGGKCVEETARNGRYVELPYVVKGMDLSFAGIVTSAIQKMKQGIPIPDICYSLQETCFAMLIEVTERALAHTGKTEVLLVGGVAANKRFSEMIGVMAKERNAKVFVVPQEYAGDCGAMIAWAGLLVHGAGQDTPIEKSGTDSSWRADEVDVKWA
jgi:N6-L-threonylcarbamoyladenine synthase/protein kinase Bud32